MQDLGFILTRHVTNETTNCYWNTCVQQIRKFYSEKIIVIDDNSNSDWVKSFHEYQNVEIITFPSHPKRGEILPLYYLFKTHAFRYAVILHDSVFLQQRIPFDRLIRRQVKILPLWTFSTNKIEDKSNIFRLAKCLRNSYLVEQTIARNTRYECMLRNKNWSGCFGSMALVSFEFVQLLADKYNFFDALLPVIQSRMDRCSLERILGILIYLETPPSTRPILGDIHQFLCQHGMEWGFSFRDYQNRVKKRGQILVDSVNRIGAIKVYTGR